MVRSAYSIFLMDYSFDFIILRILIFDYEYLLNWVKTHVANPLKKYMQQKRMKQFTTNEVICVPKPSKYTFC